MTIASIMKKVQLLAIAGVFHDTVDALKITRVGVKMQYNQEGRPIGIKMQQPRSSRLAFDGYSLVHATGRQAAPQTTQMYQVSNLGALRRDGIQTSQQQHQPAYGTRTAVEEAADDVMAELTSLYTNGIKKK